jgi:hypothetical protein
MINSANGLRCRMTSIPTECALKRDHTRVRLRPTRKVNGQLVVNCQEPCGMSMPSAALALLTGANLHMDR